MMKKVFIAVGHGGRDPGAVANGFQEKNLNLSIALACKNLVRIGNTFANLTRGAIDPLDFGVYLVNGGAEGL